MRVINRLEDDERRDGILDKWSHIAPSLPCSASNSAASTASRRIKAGPRSETSSLASDVRRAKADVDKLSERMHRLEQRS